jgi:hypothetical protein
MKNGEFVLLLKKKYIHFFIFSFIFSLVVVFFPWENIRNYDFIDLSRNIEKFKYPTYYFDYYSNVFSFKSFISDEPLWYYLNLWASNIGVSPEAFFSILAIISLTIVCFYIFNLSNGIYIVLLINPVSLDFFLSQQRSALCFVVLLSFVYFYKKVKYILFLFLPLIHSLSAMLLALFYFVENFINLKLNRKYNIVLVLLFSLIFSLFLAFGRSLLSAYTDDSRFGDYEVIVNSYLYLAPWFVYFIWFVVFSKRENLNFYFLVCFLSIYLFLSVFDFYAIRFLAMSIPFMLANINNLRYRKLFVFVFIVHQTLLMYDWLKF